ncbi:cytochrome P450 [Streptomyces sp. 150FB]|uniref:cytochrome P450 n=1 Tax=Streptomyces sp. 150FB TaxID=1576605 RepID=UPI0007C7A463|nr:cytochrome P450 [Streptomyces sp. 150FB]
MTTPYPAGGQSDADPHAWPASSYVSYGGERLLPIHGPEFSANPGATYARLRTLGPIAPVELDNGVWGYVTTTYRAALHLLRNTPDRFSKDPNNWDALRNGQIPPSTPVLGMMRPRDNALWLDGIPHSRLRQSIADSLALVDTHALTATVTRVADALIDKFASLGRCDLVADYAEPLPLHVVIDMFGSPPDVARRILFGLAKLFDAAEDADEANGELEAACLELIHLKRREPAADVTSWILAHPTGITDAEMVQQLILLVAAGTTPCTGMIANTLKLLTDDERFSGSVFDGVHSVSQAIDEVLWEDPPIANYSPLYARTPETYEGVQLQTGVPIMVSFAAANSDPALAAHAHRRAGNQAHLAFSAGVHGCPVPAPDLGRIIIETALERILDRLPDIELACPSAQLLRRPGTFSSCWLSLPVTYPAVAPTPDRPPAPAAVPSATSHFGATPWIPST